VLLTASKARLHRDEEAICRGGERRRSRREGGGEPLMGRVRVEWYVTVSAGCSNFSSKF
jgi:hypothetical protein